MADMNSIISQTLSNITCGMRFDGKLNIDLNEITSNLVPFPKMHFLVPSLSPIQTTKKILDVRNMNQLFNDLSAKDNFLIDYDLNNHTQLAMALMIRGKISLNEAQYYSEKIKKRVIKSLESYICFLLFFIFFG